MSETQKRRIRKKVMKKVILVFLPFMIISCQQKVVKEGKSYFLEIGNTGCDSVVIQRDPNSVYYLVGCAINAQLNGRYFEYFDRHDTVFGFCSYHNSYRKKIGFSSENNYYLELLRIENGSLSYPEFIQYEGGKLLSNSSFFDVSNSEDSIFIEPIGYFQDSILVHWNDSLLIATSKHYLSLPKGILEDLVKKAPLAVQLITFEKSKTVYVSQSHELNYQRLYFSKELLSVSDSLRKIIRLKEKLGPRVEEMILSKELGEQ